MGNETAYEPLKGSEGDAEAGTVDTPRWAKMIDNGEHMHWVRPYLPVLRIAVELILVFMVFLLSLKIFLWGDEASCRLPMGPNDPVKNFGYTDTVFMNESRYANEEAFLSEEGLAETMANWVELSSSIARLPAISSRLTADAKAEGRGYVDIPENERATLEGPPYFTNPLLRPNKEEIYMVSGFHQLHCLSTIMASYARLRFGKNETEMGYHIAHCFDYLRKGIMCAGDATLEGNNTAKYPGVEIPWGTAHRCVDWKALQEWADERTVFPFPPALDNGI